MTAIPRYRNMRFSLQPSIWQWLMELSFWNTETQLTKKNKTYVILLSKDSFREGNWRRWRGKKLLHCICHFIAIQWLSVRPSPTLWHLSSLLICLGYLWRFYLNKDFGHKWSCCSMTDSNTVYAKDTVVQDLFFLEKFSVHRNTGTKHSSKNEGISMHQGGNNTVTTTVHVQPSTIAN